MKKILIALVRSYQKHFSCYFAGSCIYIPSCSEYAIDAINKYGSGKGAKLAAARLLRCRKPYEGGEDPVP